MQKSTLLKNATIFIASLLLLTLFTVYSCSNNQSSSGVKTDSTTTTMSDTTVKKMDSTMKKNGTLKDSIPDSTHKTEQAPPPKH